MYDERMASLRTDGKCSSYDHPGLVHSDMDFTPSPRHENKALSNSPTRPMSDGITMGASSVFERLMMSISLSNATLYDQEDRLSWRKGSTRT